MNVGKDLFGLRLVTLVIFVASVAVLDHAPIRPAGTGVYDQGSGWDLLHIFLGYLMWALAAPCQGVASCSSSQGMVPISARRRRAW